MKNKKIFFPGQLLIRLGTFLIREYDEDVQDGIYLVLGIIDSDGNKEKFVEYAVYKRDRDIWARNFQYRMIAPDGTIACFNTPYMEGKYKVIS